MMHRLVLMSAVLGAACSTTVTHRADTTMAAAAETDTTSARPMVYAGPAPLQVDSELTWAYAVASGAVSGIEPDSRLAAAAEDLLQSFMLEGSPPSRYQRNIAARRAGVAEPVPLLLMVSGTRRSEIERSLADQLSQRCRRIGCDRIGLVMGATDEGGQVVVALVMESLMRLDPVPTTSRPGEVIELHGGTLELGGPLEVLVASPRGAVETLTEVDNGSFDIEYELTEVGHYRFEILGEIDGSPTVLALFSVAVGFGRTFPPPLVPPGHTSSIESSEALLHQLVNETRQGLDLGELRIDSALERAAQAHADSMVGDAFFSHRDLHGRGPADRVVEQGLESPLVLENLAMAPTAELAFATLLESPAHLRAMLHPDTTHIGIGVSTWGDEGLNVVIVMAELHSRMTASEARERVVNSLNAARRSRELSNLGTDPTLNEAARTTAALLARLSGQGVESNEARRSAQDALMEHVLPPLRAILVTTRDLDEVASIDAALATEVSRGGVAVQVADDPEVGYHIVLLLVH